ncbi:LOW QUALITY PROTEIN: nitrogen regulatory protein P-II homolog [Vigna unguiculata]|uniref:LOW QUALITY PROTEIN: nitrogen regulatory protein P-II homolog n=1 Tax=Vigna unguiculata TaxID=3917 RepID=UPI0010165CBE|nr:LOW QUALITY PROTEIN: nitrogen regulatory protein P-II homolog [Vigna unguiculata]
MAAITGTHVFSVVGFHLREAETPLACSSLSRKRIGDCSQRNVVLRRRGNTAILPKIRAQNIPDYVPESKFYKVEAILRPWRVPQVSSGLLKMGIRGVTVSDIRGFGAQGGAKERQGGSEFSEGNFVAKVKMEIVVEKNQVEVVIDKIIEEARTGEIGDGKIFLIPVSDVIRIRTGERGEQAERMTGGEVTCYLLYDWLEQKDQHLPSFSLTLSFSLVE